MSARKRLWLVERRLTIARRGVRRKWGIVGVAQSAAQVARLTRNPFKPGLVEYRVTKWMREGT